MPKEMSLASPSRQVRRHNPLSDDLLATGPLRNKPGKRKSRNDDEEKFVDSKSSRKILKIGRDLAEEDEKDNTVDASNAAFGFTSRFGDIEDAEEDAYDQDDDEEVWGDEDDEVVEEVVS
jgi:essential nuclear protein 1